MSVQNLDSYIWNNIASFLNPFEQCKILRLCHYIYELNNENTVSIPQHDFDNDIKYWKDNFKCFAEFGFADINVKDKITILNIDNGLFDTINKEKLLYLLYFLKYHLKIAILYQPKVEEILDEDIDNYASEFYKEIKFLYALNIGDNNSINTFDFIIKYIECMINESKELKIKKCSLLKEINLNGNNLNDNCLLLFCESVNKNLTKWNNLRRLDLSDNKNISDKYIQLLFESVIIDKCNGLQYLGLESCSITDDTINYIYKLCKKYPKKVWVKHINLQFNDGITDKGIDTITNDQFVEKFPEIAKQMKIQL